MDFVRRYRAYLRDNPEGYWFKDKPYGWGWVPATWQGGIVFALYLIVFSGLLVTFTELQTPSEDDTTRFLLEVFAWAASFVYVCYATGEPPKWMWGFPKKKK